MKKNSKLAKSLKFFNAIILTAVFMLALANVVFATTDNTGTVNSFLEQPYIKIIILVIAVVLILSILYSLAQSDQGYSKEKLQRQKDKLNQKVGNDNKEEVLPDGEEISDLEKSKVEIENMILEEQVKKQDDKDKIKIYEPTIEELLIDSATESEIVTPSPIIIDRDKEEFSSDFEPDFTPEIRPKEVGLEVEEITPAASELEKEMEKEVAEVEKPKRGRGRPRKVKVEELTKETDEVVEDDDEDLTKQFLANMHSNMKNNN